VKSLRDVGNVKGKNTRGFDSLHPLLARSFLAGYSAGAARNVSWSYGFKPPKGRKRFRFEESD